MKKLTKIVSVIILLAIALLIFVITNLDRGIKTAVESIGPEITQSQVTLSSVDLSLTTAKGSFSGLRVGNPEGFAAANAFTLGEISFAMNAESLATDTIIIESLRIVAPEITMERADGRSNLIRFSRISPLIWVLNRAVLMRLPVKVAKSLLSAI